MKYETLIELTPDEVRALSVGSSCVCRIHVHGKLHNMPALIVGRWPLNRDRVWSQIVVSVNGATNIRFTREGVCTTDGFGDKTKLMKVG